MKFLSDGRLRSLQPAEVSSFPSPVPQTDQQREVEARLKEVRAIFSGNNARLYGLQKHAETVKGDRLAALKADYLTNGGRRRNLRYGHVAKPA